jgi:Alpha-glutamyl/putrescinyl thymine pyrophosphorylase clade 3
LWDWARISADPKSFRNWLATNQTALQGRRFSNHRKYESLNANSDKGAAAVFESYVAWVAPPRTHQALIRETHQLIGQNPKDTFEHLYKTMNVKRFGRLGKFDFLTMLGKLGIAPIEAGSAYLCDNATGPLKGARLLFTGSIVSTTGAKTLDALLPQLDNHLNVGMQALEDALCN